MPTLARIQIYPFKSLDPLRLERATLLASGAIENDRRFALVNRRGDYVNGKSTPKLHLLRSSFDLTARVLSVRVEGTEHNCSFQVDSQIAPLTAWLEAFLQQPISIVENADAGFPDDTEAPGPTLVSTATLEAVSQWFGLDTADVRNRFRANLEIDGVEPFWEDRLVAPGMRVVRFTIGEAELLGTGVCQRCPVPTRSPQTGEVIAGFARTFAERRQATLPAWAPVDRFEHFYRLAVNTRTSRATPRELAVGQEVRILGVE